MIGSAIGGRGGGERVQPRSSGGSCNRFYFNAMGESARKE